MNCFLDSSVILRKLLRQSEALAEWTHIQKGFASRLLRLEVLRTIDRLRLSAMLSDEDTAEARDHFFRLAQTIGLFPVTPKVLECAERTFPTPIGSLDSIHLATALMWREQAGFDFVFATHDAELATAAKAHGFKVIGI